jgi:sugar phosphate isomerase/epimerase
MYLTGFADEAAGDIDGQIKATKELGWKYIEARNINGKNLHDITDAEFDQVCGKLEQAGVKINCFGSAIGNWAKKITDPFDITEAEVKRAIPRMQRLGAKIIRIMSYSLLPGKGPDDQMAEERIRRLREIKKRFNEAGLEPVHENCGNWGGLGWNYTLKMLENVPGLKLVFDTGNPVESEDFSRPEPRPRQSSWEFYAKVRPSIAYIHVKDGLWDETAGKVTWTFPGEGKGDVKKILSDLVKTGYDGGISIEPHMAVVAHDPSVTNPDHIRFANYVEYGRRTRKILEKAGAKISQ